MANKKEKRVALGTIELSSEVYVSDPCYGVDTWCQAFVSSLKSGKYQGFMTIKDFGPDALGGIRVTNLWVAHENNIKNYPTTLISHSIGVDSGSAGIFDKDYYEKYHPLEDSDNGENAQWYERQFKLRYDCDKEGIALDGKGVVSFSGFGDGSYSLYAGKNSKNEIVSLRIRFI